MSIWKTFPLDTPDDLDTVWVRVKYYYGTPFLAVYHLTDQRFISCINTITYPVWTISRWKPL